jgi:hypothetical protein
MQPDPGQGPAGREHVLSDESLDAWRHDGFLLMRGALAAGEVAALREVAGALHQEHLRRNPGGGLFLRPNVIADHPALLALVDHPRTFPVVLGLLGPDVQLSQSRLLIRPAGSQCGEFLHTDGGQAMGRIRLAPDSAPLQVKVSYCLTDLTGQEAGNFVVVPGSHLVPFPPGGVREASRCAGAVQLLLTAGDAVLFPHSLWHGAVENHSAHDRQALIYCYCQQFLRPYDHETPPAELLPKCTPRQRRLLGDLGGWRPGCYYFPPADQTRLMGAGGTA